MENLSEELRARFDQMKVHLLAMADFPYHFTPTQNDQLQKIKEIIK